MIRHLPKAPAKRFWVTGNYLYDYRSNEYGIGAYMQALLIGDPLTDLPSIGIIRLDQEALGRYTGQHTVTIDLNSHSIPFKTYLIFYTYITRFTSKLGDSTKFHHSLKAPTKLNRAKINLRCVNCYPI